MKFKELHKLIDETYTVYVLNYNEAIKILFNGENDDTKLSLYDDHDVESIGTERIGDSYGHEDRICVYLYGKDEDEI